MIGNERSATGVCAVSGGTIEPGAHATTDRRKHARAHCGAPAAIVLGPATLVFCRARDLSAGGICVELPSKFKVRVGEELVLGRCNALGGERRVIVVATSGQRCHCAFGPPSAE